MEVKAGFKSTEVGVIPAEWDVVRVGDLVKSGPKNGCSGRTSGDPTKTPTLSLSATTSGRLVINEDTVKYLEAQVRSDSDLFLRTDDVLVQRSNTIDLVGTTAVYSGPGGTFIYPDLMMRLRFADRVTAHWFWRYANSSGGRRYFMSVAAGSTGSMPKLSGDKLRDMLIPVPPKPEREAIVAVLSDADDLIESLEQLIAKKRQVKHGAMQELLTGRKRLQGFSGDWEVGRLGDHVVTDPETLGSETLPGFTFNYISLEDVDRGALRGHSEHVFRTAPLRARRLLRANDVLVSTVRPNLMSHLLFGSRMGEWVCSTGFCVVRCRHLLSHPYFVYSQLFTDEVKKQIEALLTGSSYPAINSRDVRELRLPWPEYDEQSAIAAILSDMDAEIAALEAKLAKARRVKHGMTQTLLTGWVRLSEFPHEGAP